jgi:uncharacterized membrane protein YhaH (DUF805 family)
VQWYLKVIRQYAVFDGRARRKEYWMFLLMNILFAVLIAIAEKILGTGGILGLIYSLVFFIPGIAVSARRLHDIDKSAWWMLIIIIPLIGPLILLYFAASDGTPGSNRFGPNPK